MVQDERLSPKFGVKPPHEYNDHRLSGNEALMQDPTATHSLEDVLNNVFSVIRAMKGSTHWYDNVVTMGGFKGGFADEAALRAAFPTGEPGWFAVVGIVDDHDEIWIWDTGEDDWVNTGSSGSALFERSLYPAVIPADVADIDTAIENLITNPLYRAGEFSIATADAEVGVSKTITKQLRIVGQGPTEAGLSFTTPGTQWNYQAELLELYNLKIISTLDTEVIRTDDKHTLSATLRSVTGSFSGGGAFLSSNLRGIAKLDIVGADLSIAADGTVFVDASGARATYLNSTQIFAERVRVTGGGVFVASGFGESNVYLSNGCVMPSGAFSANDDGSAVLNVYYDQSCTVVETPAAGSVGTVNFIPVPHITETVPNGVVDPALLNATYDNATQVFTISSAGGQVWLDGQKVNVANGALAAHANLPGAWYLKVAANGTISVSQSIWDLLTDAPLKYLYRTPLGNHLLLNERHRGGYPYGWNKAQHLHHHLYYGCLVKPGTGFALSGITYGGTALAQRQFAISGGTLADEDLETPISPLAAAGPYQRWYRSGNGTAFEFTAAADPLILNGAAPRYNQFTGGAWQLTDVPTGRYWNQWVFGCPADDTQKQFMVVLGQAVYSSQALAEAETLSANLQIGDMPLSEMVPLFRITYQRSPSGNISTTSSALLIGQRLTLSGFNVTSVHNSQSGRDIYPTHPAASLDYSETVTGDAENNVQSVLERLSGWRALAETTDFVTTAPSSSTITLNTDQTANISVGDLVSVTANAVTRPYMVKSVTWGGATGTLTLLGSPIATGAGLVTAIRYNVRPNLIQAVGVSVPSKWADGLDDDLLSTDAKGKFRWPIGDARVIDIIVEQVSGASATADFNISNGTAAANDMRSSDFVVTQSPQDSQGLIVDANSVLVKGQLLYFRCKGPGDGNDEGLVVTVLAVENGVL